MFPARKYSAPAMRLLLVVVLANYAAQVVYYLRLYYPAPPALGTISLALTLMWFLAGYLGTQRDWRLGLPLLVTYLLTMVGFYLYNTIEMLAHGYGVLWHFQHHDLPVRVVFAIGDLNLIVGIVALAALLMRRGVPTERTVSTNVSDAR